MKRNVARLLSVVGTCVSAQAASIAPAAAQSDRVGAAAHDVIAQRVTGVTGLERQLEAAGRTRFLVRLSETPVALSQNIDGDAVASSRAAAVTSEQDAFMSEFLAAHPEATVLARTKLVLNAIVLEVPTAMYNELRGHPSVARVSQVRDYELMLDETVPYIGAAEVQRQGLNGAGVRVAVFDSGIDYTHAAFGGPGTVEGYLASAEDASNVGDDFPTARIVGGFDFTGEQWPDAPEAPDADPIDFDGHGTHVADIIGGDKGVAPAVDLFAVKVCSSIGPSCSGIALLQGMEFAVDPNGDGDLSDRMDIINMSLGANYGQSFDDDLAAAVDNATALGVLTVASAGNGGDQPYITGTPAAARTALSVAQTALPSAFLPFVTITAPSEIEAVSAFLPWSAPTRGVVAGRVIYGDGAGGGLDGCTNLETGEAPFAPGSLAGEIVLVDRGGCRFDEKIFNIEQAGGILGIIGLITDEPPFPGGGDPIVSIPGYMIGQTDADLLRSGAGEVVIDPTNGLDLVGSMIDSSSRGPSDQNVLKPEIGAPGQSTSAEAGTGAGVTPFGGTSGAAPMVAGAAALIKEAFPRARPIRVKRMLMTTAETEIFNTIPGVLAPVSRIGGGEVRVDRALATPVLANTGGALGSLSFGVIDVARERIVKRKRIRLRNTSTQAVRYNVIPRFRYEEDQAHGGVQITADRARITVPARGTATVEILLTLDGTRLPLNAMNGGIGGGDPATLTFTEADGYVSFEARDHELNVPWHVIPRPAANLRARKVRFDDTGVAEVNLVNRGVGPANNDAYALVAVGPDLPEGEAGQSEPTPDLKAVGVRTLFAPDVCVSEYVWEFAFASHERRSHPRPVSMEVDLDIDNDGVFDFALFNADLNAFDPDTPDSGQSVSWVLDIAAGTTTPLFFANTSMSNSSTTVLLACGEDLGLPDVVDNLNNENTFSQVTASFFAVDAYFGGPGATLGPVVIAPFGEQFFASAEDVAGGVEGTLTVTDFGALPGNSPEFGVLMITDAFRGLDNTGASLPRSEAVLLDFAVSASCTPAASDCFEELETPGCDSPTCDETVCEVDGLCCFSGAFWDGLCAQQAAELCDVCP